MDDGKRSLFCRAILPAFLLLFFSKEINTFLSSTAVPPDVPESGPKSAHLCFKCGLLGKSLSSLGEIFHNSSHSRTETFDFKNICLPRAGRISLTDWTMEKAARISSGPSRGGENSYQLGSGQSETTMKVLVVEKCNLLLNSESID